MNSLSRPMLGSVALLIGMAAGLIGGRALFTLAVSGGAGQVKLDSGGTKGGAGRKGEPKEVRQVVTDLLRDSAQEGVVNPRFLEFVSQTGEWSADELAGALDQFLFLVEPAVAENSPEGPIPLQSKTILETLLTRLVALDPNGAGQWMVVHKNLALVQVLSDVWKAIARKDLPLMARLIRQMPEDERVKLQAIRLKTMAQQNPAQAGAALEELQAGDPQWRTDYSSARKELLEEYMKVNPVAAANLGLKLWRLKMPDVVWPEKPQDFPLLIFNDPFSGVLASWAERDDAAATAWVLQQKGHNAALAASVLLQRGNGVGLYEKSAEVLSNLAGVDVEYEILQFLLGQFANHFMREGGEETAWKWVSGIADPSLQKVAQEKMNEAWVQSDPAAASLWLADSSPGPEKDRLITILVNKIRAEDGERAFIWSQKIGSEAVRQLNMVRAMESWLMEDPLPAAKALEQASPEVRQALKEK